MMWSLVIMLAVVLSVESYSVHDFHERLAHGRQLKIYLPKSVEKLEFTPADEPGNTFLLWEGRHRLNRGKVSGTGNDRRWYIDKVTYEDQGTYTQRDYWNKDISTVKVAVTSRHNYIKRIPGETLSISLEGLKLVDASLAFSGDAANVTLVLDGALVSQDLPHYWDRVKTYPQDVRIRDVNTSDVGRYTLTDRKNRVVSITRMDLTDHHEYSGGNPLLALLLLLGIPAGICCCCRKKIFKQKATSTNTLQGTPETVHPPPGGPMGPPPSYNTPTGPGAPYYHSPDPNMSPMVHPPPGPAVPGQWSGPAPAGFNPAYPPQNPVYPPTGPSMVPPAQPPQWSGPPPGQYVPPGPGAPMYYPEPAMGYSAPVMYSAPAAGSEVLEEKVKMGNIAASPTDPLLTPAPQPAADSSPSAPVQPSSTGSAYQFQIDTGKNSSTNFL